ncbi:PepSY-associated TM helix domain-containing protein [Filimonas lacunae]|uniref:PepSY-associated TM helix domain-containing protein n=1 Tax=Filimonas lacunae TaxID=477680 RepID=UPI0018D59F22|nr:PepSY-associated TM helix domain-containing protein [Filimonas lacunae]
MFRRINDWLHLWLGLASGIVVVIVSITGCIYVFEREIRTVTEPFQYVKAENKPLLPPSVLKQKAELFAFGGKTDTLERKINGVTYNAPGYAVMSNYSTKAKGYCIIYQNPYTGEVLKEKRLETDFFRTVLMGHYYLWLPHEVGHVVVGWAIFIFLLLLITGLIMWWPKNLKKANVDKSFKIKWGASFKRVNYDLHNVMGFYVLLVAFAIAVTGLVWSFEWFSKSYYWTLSGGKTLNVGRNNKPKLDSASLTKVLFTHPEDVLWQRMMAQYPNNQGSLQVQFAAKKGSTLNIGYNPQAKTYYKREFRSFHPATLEEIKGKGIYAMPYAKATVADKIYRMNYDIHVGAIAGLTGKIIAFFASLTCATLPVTGFIIWWGKKKKKKKPAGRKKEAVHQEKALEMV